MTSESIMRSIGFNRIEPPSWLSMEEPTAAMYEKCIGKCRREVLFYSAGVKETYDNTACTVGPVVVAAYLKYEAEQEPYIYNRIKELTK